MYHYFIDSTLNHPRYTKDLDLIDTRLTDLGIKGKITRLTHLHDLGHTLEEATKHGARTLVCIGNDHLLSRMVSFLRRHPHCLIGIIPLGRGPFLIARALGIAEGLPACDIVAARRTEALDVGCINSTELFLSAVEIEHMPSSLTCDHKFMVCESAPMHAVVQNLISFRYPSGTDDPTDGVFSLRVTTPPDTSRIFKKTMSVHTFLTARTVDIKPMRDEVSVTVDGFRHVRAPLTLEILPKHLSFIVGKTRTF